MDDVDDFNIITSLNESNEIEFSITEIENPSIKYKSSFSKNSLIQTSFYFKSFTETDDIVDFLSQLVSEKNVSISDHTESFIKLKFAFRNRSQNQRKEEFTLQINRLKEDMEGPVNTPTPDEHQEEYHREEKEPAYEVNTYEPTPSPTVGGNIGNIMVINLKTFEQDKTINLHAKAIRQIIELKNIKYLASCSYDCSLSFFDLDKFEYTKTIKNAHNISVLSLCELEYVQTNEEVFLSQSGVKNAKLATCGGDYSIKIWLISFKNSTINSTKEIYEIKNAHMMNITKIIPLTKNRFATCSWDKLIRLWNNNSTYDKLITLGGHKSTLYNIIQLNTNKLLVSGGADKLLKFWDVTERFKVRCTLENIYVCDCNCMFEVEDKKKLLIGDLMCINIINLNKSNYEFEVENKIEGFRGYVKSFTFIRNDDIICGDGEGYVYLIDIIKARIMDDQEDEKNEALLFNSGENNSIGMSIWSLINVDNRKLIAAYGADGNIKILKY